MDSLKTLLFFIMKIQFSSSQGQRLLGRSWQLDCSWLFIFMLCFSFSAKALDLDTASCVRQKGLLWRIEKPDVAPSYLLGTMHVSANWVNLLVDDLEPVIQGAKGLVLETLLNDNSQIEMTQAMMFSNGKKLDEYLTPPEMAQIKENIPRNSLYQFALQGLKPWAVYMLLSMPSTPPGISMDALLKQRFEQNNKPVYGIESVTEQIQIFDTLAMGTQVALLRDALNNLSARDQIFKNMVNYYLNEDLDGLWGLRDSLLNGSGEQTLYFEKKMILERNYLMHDRIQSYLKKGGYLVAVGALHLPGQDGLLCLLSRQGYQIKAQLRSAL